MTFYNPHPSGGTISIMDEGLTVASAISSINFVGPGVTATAIGGAVTITIPGTGTLTFVDEMATNTGDSKNFTISSAPVTNSLILYNENTGQVYTYSDDYSLSGTTVTFNSPQPGVTIRAHYASAASGISFADEQATGGPTSFSISHSPISGSLLVYNENTGQVYTNVDDYSISGTTITFVTPQAGVTVRTKYAY